MKSYVHLLIYILAYWNWHFFGWKKEVYLIELLNNFYMKLIWKKMQLDFIEDVLLEVMAHVQDTKINGLK
jgi:hypothetical protein